MWFYQTPNFLSNNADYPLVFKNCIFRCECSMCTGYATWGHFIFLRLKHWWKLYNFKEHFIKCTCVLNIIDFLYAISLNLFYMFLYK